MENDCYMDQSHLIHQQICLILSYNHHINNGGESPRRFGGPGTLVQPKAQHMLHLYCMIILTEYFSYVNIY